LHRLGERKLSVAAVAEHAHELLGVERVATRALEQGFLQLRGEEWALEQRVDELRRLLVGERRERECERVRLAAAPAGTA
jgi:hypothetical protein